MRGSSDSTYLRKQILENLEKNGFLVDYIVTHAAPESIVRNEINNAHRLLCLDCKAEMFLDKVLEKAVYRHWYCGVSQS